jgi:DNA polymerase-3 subunit delta
MKLGGAQLKRFLEKPDKNIGAALFYGPNASLISESAAALAAWALKGSDDPYALTKLHEDEIKRDSALLSDALCAQSLLGGPTVVLARIDGKAAESAVLAALKDIEAGAPRGYLVIEGGDLGGSSALVKAFNDATRAACAAIYEETDSDRADFARRFLAEEKVQLDRDAQDVLAAALPSDRGLARKELEKLAIYAHDLGRPLNQSDLNGLLAEEADGALDVATLAAASGKGAQAMEALSRMENLSGVSALRALSRRMLQVHDARSLMDQGMSASDAVGKLRPPVFWKERDAVAGLARAWTAKKLNAAFDALWHAERRAKNSGMPQDLVAADAFRAVAALVGR